MAEMKESPVKSNPVKRQLYCGLVYGLFLLVLCGAMSIPFIYQSQTLWYKVGFDKIILRSGQVAGLLAAVLLFVQILLAARGKILVELFGVAALIRWHRVNGILICLFAFCHVVLILAPEGIANLPIGKKHWPEMVGAVLFLIILSMVISSRFRQQLSLVYKRWRAIHKALGYLALLLVTVHVLFVSESFEYGVPKTALLSVLALVTISVLLTKKTLRRGQRPQGK